MGKLDDIAKLRELTKTGLRKCKEAYEKARGNMQEALRILADAASEGAQNAPEGQSFGGASASEPPRAESAPRATGSKKGNPKTADTLNIAIDLGCESVKVAYAFCGARGELKYGKLEADGEPYPATVSYSRESGRWLIGTNIEGQEDFSYDTIVRIKDLISLLIPQKGAETVIDNSRHYETGKHFPKFFFPQKRKAEPNFANAIRKDQTYEADLTQKELCEKFFEKLFSDLISPDVREILAANPEINKVRYVSVYPQKANKKYIAELERLIAHAAKSRDVSSMSYPKAVAVGAYYDKILSNDVAAIMVDIGERDISVTKVAVTRYGNDVSVNIEGADGHNEPDEIGGEDFDEALAELIEEKAGTREVLGSGAGGGSDERGTYRQQYILMRNIKGMKSCFSMPKSDFDVIFGRGVPIQLELDVAVELSVTKDEYVRKLFESRDSVGEKIADYINRELRNPADDNVGTVLLTGGGASSYYLAEYLERHVRGKRNPEIKLYDTGSGGSSAFAAAFGAAMLSPSGITLKLHSALTYGTWVDGNMIGANGKKKYVKKFGVLLNKGDVIPEEGISPSILINTQRNVVEGDEFFSYPAKITSTEELFVGDPGSPVRAEAIRRGLKVVSGGDGKAKIYFTRKNQSGTETRFENFGDRGAFYFREGFRIDPDGRAFPFVENAVKENREKNPLCYDFLDVTVHCDGFSSFQTGD